MPVPTNKYQKSKRTFYSLVSYVLLLYCLLFWRHTYQISQVPNTHKFISIGHAKHRWCTCITSKLNTSFEILEISAKFDHALLPLKWNKGRNLQLEKLCKKTIFSGGSLFCKFPPSTDQLRVFSHLFLTAKLDCQDQGRSASSWPASSARWSPPWPPYGRRAAWRWGSQGRRGRPAKPSTTVSNVKLPQKCA